MTTTRPNTVASLLSLAIVLPLLVDDTGNVDWDASLPGLQKKINDLAEESKAIRADVCSILNKYPGEFISEDTVVDKVVSRRQTQMASSRRATDEDFHDTEVELSLEEVQVLRRKVEGFMTANKPQETDTGNSMLLSSKGRGGGIQTRRNALAIMATRASKKNK